MCEQLIVSIYAGQAFEHWRGYFIFTLLSREVVILLSLETDRCLLLLLPGKGSDFQVTGTDHYQEHLETGLSCLLWKLSICALHANLFYSFVLKC